MEFLWKFAIGMTVFLIVGLIFGLYLKRGIEANEKEAKKKA